MKFSKKKVFCETAELQATINQTKLEWLKALLLRLKLDPDKVESALTDPNIGLRDWRDYLILSAGLNILKNGDEVIVEKHYSDKPKRLMGRWEKPEIVRVKKEDKFSIELRLKYWQFI